MLAFFQFLFSFPTICLAALYTQKQRLHKEDDCSTLLYSLPWENPTSANYLFSALLPSHPVKDRSQEIRESSTVYTQKQRLRKEDDCSTLLYPLPWDKPTSANYLFFGSATFTPCKGQFLFSFPTICLAALYTQKQRLHKEDDCSTLLYPLPWDNPTFANYLFSALLPSHPVKDRSQEIRESCKSSEGKNF
ncbi:hypothetical protein CEXT_577901 [Caerostris extrusa]|uniref:Uncharacterized protein n=1 Tax=Caerostris extrusa TaxID=172846 RepID=A0AAV4SGD8_CAEEX|nr:hypothetical protein CEXT_577901 [Caerostris extrusa]